MGNERDCNLSGRMFILFRITSLLIDSLSIKNMYRPSIFSLYTDEQSNDL